jgi:DNA-directed RNA polymerase subunit M/transcription elongation factor TFIIS
MTNETDETCETCGGEGLVVAEYTQTRECDQDEPTFEDCPDCKEAR